MFPQKVDNIDDLINGHGPVFASTNRRGNNYCVTGTVGLFVLWEEQRGRYKFIDREPTKMTLSGSLVSSSVGDVRKAATSFMNYVLDNMES